MRLRCLILQFIFISLSFFRCSIVYASSIFLHDGSPNTIENYEQEYQVGLDLSINAPSGTVYYLRGVFYKQGTSNYCGYTWNGTSWFKGPYSTNEGWKNFYAVTISSSSASTILKAKLDSDDNDCRDSGIYNFKVQRFTQNSGSGTFDSQNEQSINVILPTITPTFTVSPTLKPEATSIPVKLITVTLKAENSPTAIKKLTATAYNKISSDEAKINSSQIEETENNLVLGESIHQSTNEGQRSNRMGISMPIIVILLGGGAIFTGLAVFFSIKEIKKKNYMV